MQKWVSIYETNECDIRTPDIYRFPQVDELSTGPQDRGVTVMKAKLQEKYIPPSYKTQLFSNMINLKQMTPSVYE